MSRRRGRWVWSTLLALVLCACATAETPPPVTHPSTLSTMAQLPGWSGEDHAAAFAAVRYACQVAPVAGRSAVCGDVLAAGALGEAAARAFLEAHFRADAIEGQGLLTGYFSPRYEARPAPAGDFTAPLRPLPADLSLLTADRALIEQAPAPDALAWMRPEDLFLLQIQGSGELTFPDGARRRAVFAAANGRPFVGIAGPMVARGLIPRETASSATVHDWLAAHPGPDAAALMDLDPRYIFFRLVADDGGEPTGAAGAPLIAGRSLAVDPDHHPDFELLWVDAHGGLPGARPVYQRLAVALDRGGAIKGPVRADLYLGSGPTAGDEAARVRHQLTLYRITPVSP